MRFAFVTADARPTTLRALNYSPFVEAFRARRSTQRHVALGELVADFGGGYGSIFKGIDCSPEYGVEMLSQKDLFMTRPQGRVIRRDSVPELDRHRIRRWQVLLAGTGTLGETELYGRAMIADHRLEGKHCGPDIFALTFKDVDGPLSLFTYAFLCTTVGLQAIRSTSYGTKLLRQRQDMLADLPIPMPDESTVRAVGSLITRAVVHRDRYAELMVKAKAVLEALPEMQSALPMCRERQARAVQWHGELRTMTAWLYASTGGALEHLSSAWRTRLGNILTANGIFNGLRFARVPCQRPHGVDLLSQRDVFMMRPVGRRIAHPGMDDRYLFVPDHALLVASHGQLTEGSLFGRVELASVGFTKAAITQDILRLVPESGYSALLYTYFSTVVGHRMLQSAAVGTSVPILRLDLLTSLPIPDIGAAKLQAISELVQQAVRARVEAASAEAEAIRIIEQEVIPAWLA